MADLATDKYRDLPGEVQQYFSELNQYMASNKYNPEEIRVDQVLDTLAEFEEAVNQSSRLSS
jgi:hypothetical protein